MSWRGIAPVVVLALIAGWLLLGRGTSDELSTDPDPANQARVAAFASCPQRVQSDNTILCVPAGWQAFAPGADERTPPALSDAPVVDDLALTLQGPTSRIMGMQMPTLSASLTDQLPTMTPEARAEALSAAIDNQDYEPFSGPTVPGAYVFVSPNGSETMTGPIWTIVRGRERFALHGIPNAPDAQIDGPGTEQAVLSILTSWAWRVPADETVPFAETYPEVAKLLGTS